MRLKALDLVRPQHIIMLSKSVRLKWKQAVNDFEFCNLRIYEIVPIKFAVLCILSHSFFTVFLKIIYLEILEGLNLLYKWKYY